MATATEEKPRCAWCLNDPLYIRYHDEEWGRPVHDDQILFEFLVLESFQAGLSWLTVLKKRENFRKAFADFDVDRVAKFSEKKVESLMGDAGIIRNRLKIEAAVAFGILLGKGQPGVPLHVRCVRPGDVQRGISWQARGNLVACRSP